MLYIPNISSIKSHTRVCSLAAALKLEMTNVESEQQSKHGLQAEVEALKGPGDDPVGVSSGELLSAAEMELKPPPHWTDWQWIYSAAAPKLASGVASLPEPPKA